MDKTRIGSVLSLWRFPVKSMQGEQLTEVELGTEAIAGWLSVAFLVGKEALAPTRADSTTGSGGQDGRA